VLGYKQQYDISLIENANRMLDPIELENFARLYGKSLNDFATLRNDRPTTEELQDELKKRSKQLAKRRLFSKRKPTMTAEQIADIEKQRRRYFEAQALKESSEKS